MLPIASEVVGREGNRFLLADSGNDPMRPARAHDVSTGEITLEHPLQLWFKWGVWEYSTDVDYRTAQREKSREAQP